MYDKLMESKPEITKRVAEAPKPVKPGVAQQRNQKGEAYTKLRTEAKKSGRADVAASRTGTTFIKDHYHDCFRN